MSKSIEQAVHDIDVPQPGMAGEDFDSYMHRVVYVAFLAGAAWSISSGPQVQPPIPQHVHDEEPEGAPGLDDLPGTDEQPPPPEGVLVAEGEGDGTATPWDARPEGEVTDGPLEDEDTVTIGGITFDAREQSDQG